jgi:hypothetical protein
MNYKHFKPKQLVLGRLIDHLLICLFMNVCTCSLVNGVVSISVYTASNIRKISES